MILLAMNSDTEESLGQCLMWCRGGNIETNDTICPVCSEITVEDIPIEIFGCTL